MFAQFLVAGRVLSWFFKCMPYGQKRAIKCLIYSKSCRRCLILHRLCVVFWVQGCVW